MAHSHQATESRTYGRRRLRYTVESHGPFPGPLPWRNTSSCPRRRGPCRWSTCAICQKTKPHKMLCAMRWPDTDGAPVCPKCNCAAVYTYRCRRVFKCKACHRQFSATSGTSLAYRKLPFRTLLMAFSLFVNAAKGISSLQLSRYLGLHAKTAFVLLHK